MKDIRPLQKAGVYRLSLKIEESFSIFSNLANSGEMSETVAALLCFRLVTESLNICTGNAFASLVFRIQRFSVKRCYYLLLHLALAPLFVSVTYTVSLLLINKKVFSFFYNNFICNNTREQYLQNKYEQCTIWPT